jgi:hypothetical protein
MVHKWSLPYRRIRCTRCGEERIVGVPCPTCGMKPDEREVDPSRQARQAVVQRVRDAWAAPLPPPSGDLSTLATDSWDRLSAFIDSFIGGLAGAAADPPDDREVLAAVQAFRQLEADIAGVPRLRPWRGLWKAIDEVVDRLRSVADHYLASAVADLPIDAQRESRLAQAGLDKAAEPASDASRLTELWKQAEEADSREAFAKITIERAYAMTGATNLSEFDGAGDRVFHRVTGQFGCPRGIGVGLNTIAAEVEVGFDQDRFWTVAREVYEKLAMDSAWLQQLVSDPTWKEDVQSGLLSLWEAGRLQHAALAAARHDREAVRALLQYGKDLVETVGKRYAATLLAAHKTAPYTKYRDQPSGGLLVAVDQAGLGNVMTGVDRAIRTASAHDEFFVVGDEVVLMDRGLEVERLSSGVLVDRMLAGVESAMAIGLGVFCAAIVAGIDVADISPPAESLGLETTEAASWVLAELGWTETDVAYSEGELRVRGRIDPGDVATTHAAALVPYLPDDCWEISFVAASENGESELRGPLDSLRRSLSTGDEDEKLLANIEVLARWSRDGRPLLLDSQRRKLLAVYALQAAANAGTPQAAIARVRRVRECARALNDVSVDAAIGEVIAGLRESMMSGNRARLSAALDALGVWAAARVPPIAT